ncbi:MAG: hypothetical protein IIA35_07000 [Proteobacteria bacterium]|nr:hypothetical protein [Pseudomonadota bacterium]
MTRTPVRETFVELGGKRVPVRLYRNTRARRIILRIDDRNGTGDGNGDGVALSFRFPPQDSKLAEGSSVCLASDTKSAGRIQALDLDRGILELIPTKRRREEGLPTVFSLTPGGPINDMVLRGAVERYVASLPSGGEKFRATTAILCRELPRISGVEPGAPIMDEGIDVIEGTSAAVQGLEESYLYVQGPPGWVRRMWAHG